jgi:hypothetical protein
MRWRTRQTFCLSLIAPTCSVSPCRGELDRLRLAKCDKCRAVFDEDPHVVLGVAVGQGAGAVHRQRVSIPGSRGLSRASSPFHVARRDAVKPVSDRVRKQPRPLAARARTGVLAISWPPARRSGSRRGFAPSRLARMSRFAPHATEVLRCHGASLCAATNGHCLSSSDGSDFE